MSKTHPWHFEGNTITCLADMPEGIIGFIYKINNLTTGKYYIGRKTVASIKKKKLTLKEKLLPENKRKTFKYDFCESTGWKNYCGSNLILKAEAAEGHKIIKTILKYCFSKAELTLEESKAILCGGALQDPLSYNMWVSCKIYKRNLIEE